MAFQSLDFWGSAFDLFDTGLSVIASMWYWPVGIITTLINGVLYWRLNLYADFSLQIVYLVMFGYGWWYWLRGGQNHSKRPISLMSRQQLLQMVALWLLITSVGCYILKHHTNSTTPLWDASTASLYLIGQWLMAKKYLQCWYFWFVGNFLYLGLYWHKGVLFHAGLEFIYLGTATAGYFYWRKLYRQQHQTTDLDPTTTAEAETT